MMIITDHAVRKYKKRVGKRTSSKRRIVDQINKDLKKDVIREKKSKVKNHYILITSKYQAVCYKNMVITILALEEEFSQYEYERERMRQEWITDVQVSSEPT